MGMWPGPGGPSQAQKCRFMSKSSKNDLRWWLLGVFWEALGFPWGSHGTSWMSAGVACGSLESFLGPLGGLMGSLGGVSAFRPHLGVRLAVSSEII